MTGALSTSPAISPRMGVVRWTLEPGRLVTARELGSAGHRLGDAMGRARRARRIAQSAAYGGGFGIAGIGAAVLGWLADLTSIEFVYHICAFLPAIGLLAAFLPETAKPKRERSRAKS